MSKLLLVGVSADWAMLEDGFAGLPSFASVLALAVADEALSAGTAVLLPGEDGAIDPNGLVLDGDDAAAGLSSLGAPLWPKRLGPADGVVVADAALANRSTVLLDFGPVDFCVSSCVADSDVVVGALWPASPKTFAPGVEAEVDVGLSGLWLPKLKEVELG